MANSCVGNRAGPIEEDLGNVQRRRKLNVPAKWYNWNA